MDTIKTKTNTTDYERKRLENIQRNNLKLKELEIKFKNTLSPPLAASENQIPDISIQKPPQKKLKRNTNIVKNIPTRSSTRNTFSEENTRSEQHVQLSDQELQEPLLNFHEYFKSQEILDNAIVINGHYTGWLSQRIMDTYGIEKSASEAWESNGGGKFSFKSTKESNSGKPAGWSNAKFQAYKMFKKNPNSYFYRHNEPGVEQWTGDWSAEEEELFLKTAKEFGCGDKWGLFASHIPHRVGYQCSNFYRNVILTRGYIIDNCYKYSRNGSAIFVGKENK